MPTIREALADYRNRNRLDPQSSHSPHWRLQFGPIAIRLPNFEWRKKAILKHDLHHLMTGYPCTVRGECQMATWEFAAGRYAHPASTAFCLPLVILGIVLSPKAIWTAFQSGRRGRSLYGSQPDEMLLDQDFLALRKRALGVRDTRSIGGEVLLFGALALGSALLTLTPMLLILLVWL